MKFRLLDLFSGIGGFSLGLERSGYFETVAFCEIEEYQRRVLKKHWPEVPCYGDIRELDGNRLVRECGRIDAICGGFPCQDISTAGKGAGIGGSRSGLWKEYARIIGEIRPRYVIVENVSALLARGMGTVLADLSEIGYDAEWHCIPASRVGAPHDRDRLWIIAYSHKVGRLLTRKYLDDQYDLQRGRQWHTQAPNTGWSNVQRWFGSFIQDGYGSEFVKTHGGMVDGLSEELDGIAALGNAVVPQIPELIGRAIGEYELDQIPQIARES